MRLSQRFLGLIRGRDGQAEWKEVSQLHLPDGGKKLRFITRGHMIGAAVFFFVGYAYIKSVINPDSMWGKAVNSIHEQTVQWTDTRSEEEKNAPNLDRLNSMK